MSPSEQKDKQNLLDTLFMRKYREGGKSDLKFVIVVAVLVSLVFGFFAVWMFSRL